MSGGTGRPPSRPAPATAFSGGSRDPVLAGALPLPSDNNTSSSRCMCGSDKSPPK